MPARQFQPIGAIRDCRAFEDLVSRLRLDLPFDRDVQAGPDSALAQPMRFGDIVVGNRLAIHPMEGWDGTRDGRPDQNTHRRWRRFGESGAKLIWGGEAVAVRHDGRANPNQLLIGSHSRDDLARLRDSLVQAHREAAGSTDGLLIGLQLTHSGRFSCPNAHGRHESRILYRHPILDRRQNLPDDYPILTDGDVRAIIERFHHGARVAADAGFDFVDVKHCHGYLGHEFLSAHTRAGDYGGSFENRTRFLREVVQGIGSVAPDLKIGVRVSAFDTVPFRTDPSGAARGDCGIGVPEPYEDLLPYRWGFGLDPADPLAFDLSEPIRFLSLLGELGIRLVNLTAGCPYTNPHIQRPAFYPPSDGYAPPEDPLAGVARQLFVTRELKRRFPNLLIVGSGYTYLQQFLPNVAQAAVRLGWVDAVGLGRMVLSYPRLPIDVLAGRPLELKRICRTFSDCTSAPRNGLPSGCYPLDSHYKLSQQAIQLKAAKRRD